LLPSCPQSDVKGWLALIVVVEYWMSLLNPSLPQSMADWFGLVWFGRPFILQVTLLHDWITDRIESLDNLSWLLGHTQYSLQFVGLGSTKARRILCLDSL
jgi:hypothetical protein